MVVGMVLTKSVDVREGSGTRLAVARSKRRNIRYRARSGDVSSSKPSSESIHSLVSSGSLSCMYEATPSRMRGKLESPCRASLSPIPRHEKQLHREQWE